MPTTYRCTDSDCHVPWRVFNGRQQFPEGPQRGDGHKAGCSAHCPLPGFRAILDANGCRTLERIKTA